MILYRPVGQKELELIKNNNFKKFPPRLLTQPFFYPVLNKKYAEEIAKRWNTKDKNSEFVGYITQFEIEDKYISKFKIQTVGKSYHQEFWISSDELENFNNHIMGDIKIIAKF